MPLVRPQSSPKSLANLPSVLAHSSCSTEKGREEMGIDARGKRDATRAGDKGGGRGEGGGKEGPTGRRENLFEYLG